jgi:hypothetical protein
MSTFATSKSDSLNEAGSGFLEFYFPYLESGKDKHPYNDVSALINLAALVMYWIWVFTEGKGLQAAFIAVQTRLEGLIDEDPDKAIFEASINENDRWPGRLH